jgi:membrane protease YdiL (CAAX protease family)
VLFTLIFFFLPSFFIKEAVPADLRPYILQYLFITALQLAIFFVILWQKDKSVLQTFGLIRFKPIDIFFSLGLTLTLFILLLIFNELVALLPAAWRDYLTSGFHWQPSKSISAIYLLVFSLAVGVREEFFFRSYLLTRFKELGLPRLPAILISTILFAVGHIYQGIIGLLFAFSQGILFSYFFMYRKSLPTLALAHGLYNFGTLLLATYLDM